MIQSQKKFLLDEQKKSWKKNKQTMLKKNRNFVSIIYYILIKKLYFAKILLKKYYSKNVYIDGYQTERGDGFFDGLSTKLRSKWINTYKTHLKWNRRHRTIY